MNPDGTPVSTEQTIVSLISGLSAAAAPWYNSINYNVPLAPVQAQLGYMTGQTGSLAATGPLLIIVLAVIAVIVVIGRSR